MESTGVHWTPIGRIHYGSFGLVLANAAEQMEAVMAKFGAPFQAVLVLRRQRLVPGCCNVACQALVT